MIIFIEVCTHNNLSELIIFIVDDCFTQLSGLAQVTQSVFEHKLDLIVGQQRQIVMKLRRQCRAQ